MQEGWLTDAHGYWVKRFHRDQKSYVREIKVFVDEGRRMPNGEPPLLKSRSHLRHEDAQKLWLELIRFDLAGSNRSRSGVKWLSLEVQEGWRSQRFDGSLLKRRLDCAESFGWGWSGLSALH